MTSTIITLCILLLIAYVFDLTSSKNEDTLRYSSLLLGWIVQQLSTVLHIRIPDLSGLLPLFGTVGLILIVLEGIAGTGIEQIEDRRHQKVSIGTAAHACAGRSAGLCLSILPGRS